MTDRTGNRNVARVAMAALAPLLLGGLGAHAARAEMLAILNYESKAEESLEALQLQNPPAGRREGIAIIELDRASPDYGKVLIDIPVSPDLVLHHIFYNRDLTKAYVTALGKEVLHVIDLARFPYRLQPIPTPGCNTLENIIFSDDNRTWYLTCMGSANLVVGDAATDQPVKTIDLPGTFPHGIALNQSIDRILIANCVAPDMSAVGETLEVVRASTGEHLGGIRIAERKGSAPVELLFVPGAEPPLAYITNMNEDTLWAATWNPERQDFEVAKVFDFAAAGAHMPLEIYVNRAQDRLYITSAEPGHFHIFDISGGLLAPKLITQIATAGGAHHVAFTPDESMAFVQNSLLNIPGISDGSITVIDLKAQAVVDSIDVFKKQGLTPNSITMLPAWYHPAGHFNNGPGG